MTVKFNWWVICFCLAALLHNGQEAGWALDKKMSLALSHYIMAVMQEDLGDINDAIGEYKKALTADYKNPSIHLKLASCYIKNNDILKAVDELNLAISFAPDAVEPHAILALLYSAQKKEGLVQKEYELALKNATKLEPKNVEIYKSLGIIYLQQKKYKEAENTYRLILDLSPNDSEAYFYLANVYHEQKDIEACIKALKKALQINPDYHQVLNYLGYLYVVENRDFNEAELLIKKALELDSNNGAYIDSLGWLYFKKGQYQEALKEIERASTLIEDPEIYDHLGDIYSHLGDKEKAKVNWQKSLKLDPKQDNVQKKIEAAK